MSDRNTRLFSPRVHFKPFDYPEVIGFLEAIQESYWTHRQFDFIDDVQDFKVHTNDSERFALSRSFMMISQVEVSLKTFWGKLFDRIHKPEIGMVGATFGESEVRHSMAYSHLLTLMGLEDEFEKIYDIPAVIDRHHYLTKYQDFTKCRLDERFFKSIILFTLFIENVSLFGQFITIMSFNNYKNILSDVSSVVDDTSKEEIIHASFGMWLINTIKEEYPEWWTEELVEFIRENAHKAMKAEEKTLDWIFEHGELSFLPKSYIAEFLRDRINQSMRGIGIDDLFEVNPDIMSNLSWYDLTNVMTTDTDFFYKKPGTYTRHNKPITAKDLF